MARSVRGHRAGSTPFSSFGVLLILFSLVSQYAQSAAVTETTSSSTLGGINMGTDDEQPVPPSLTEEQESNVVNQSSAHDPIQQVLGKECRGSYSPFCLKLGLMKLVERGSGATLGLWPGVSITAGRVPPAPPVYLLADPDKADTLLLDRLSEYFSSLSVNVKILDKATPMKFAKAYLGTNAASGRKKNRFGGALTAAGLLSAGTLLAAGLAALAALAGKAMMASTLALMLAALAALKGHGGQGGGEKTTYEIVAKPTQHGGHYRRSFDGFDKAYSGQKPQKQPVGIDASDALMSATTEFESDWTPKNPETVGVDRS